MLWLDGKGKCVDATAPSRHFGRLINHSCKKKKANNLIPKTITIQGIPHVYFVATKTIDAGTELHWDYGETDKRVIAENPWLKD